MLKFKVRSRKEIKNLINKNRETMLRSTNLRERDEIRNTILIVENFLNGLFEIPFAVEIDDDDVCTCVPSDREGMACKHCVAQSELQFGKEIPF